MLVLFSTNIHSILIGLKICLRDIIAHTPGLIPQFLLSFSFESSPSHQLLVTDMRLRSKLFYVFLAVLLIVASIVEASKRRKK